MLLTRLVQKVSCAKALRKEEDGGQRVKVSERIPVNSRPGLSDPNSLWFSKVGFLASIAMVINSTAQM